MSCTTDEDFRRPWTSIERQYARLTEAGDLVFTVDSARMAIVPVGATPDDDDWAIANPVDNGTAVVRVWALVGPTGSGAAIIISAAGPRDVWVEWTVGAEEARRKLDQPLDLY